ncbi:MAG: CDP-archaeol synthase [Pirellulales bacterium]|nr:CDP-archaeol synthase [Pirellulales bacterium]
MLRWRITLGVVLIAVLIGLCWLDHVMKTRGAILVPVVSILGLLAADELAQFYRKVGHPIPSIRSYIAVLIPIGSAGLSAFGPWRMEPYPVGSLGFLAMGLVGSCLFLLLSEMSALETHLPRHGRIGETTVQLALATFVTVYVGGLLGFLVLLRMLPNESMRNDWGLLALISMLCVVKLGDTGAYTVGRLIGRHKLAPRLSPGKTWEGAAGGLIASCLGAWITLILVPDWLGWTSEGMRTSWPAWSAYGLLVGFSGMLGDLAESLLKRDVGVKDSSAWLPGFGGVLDLLDSILFAAPVAFLFWYWGLVGP